MGEQEKKEGFLLPATVYKLKSFITIKDSKISEEHNDTDPALMLCQDQSGKHFIVKYSDYFVKDTQSINDLKTFFKLKSEQQVDKALTLKIKDQLEESDEFQDKLEEMIEEQELSRKDAKTFEKKYTLEQAEELAFNSWLNKPALAKVIFFISPKILPASNIASLVSSCSRITSRNVRPSIYSNKA